MGKHRISREAEEGRPLKKPRVAPQLDAKAQQRAPIRPDDVEIIQMYTNKGGVAKTTTTLNLAFALASESGSSVLLMEADPQSDLTHDALYKDFRDKQSQDIKYSWKNYLDEKFDKAGYSVKASKLADGTRYIENEFNFYTVDGVISGFFYNERWNSGEEPQEVSPVTCMQIGEILKNGQKYTQVYKNPHDMKDYSEKPAEFKKMNAPKVTLGENPGVFLAAGGKYLDEINKAFGSYNPGDRNVRHLDSSYGIIREVARKTAARYQCKYVLIDCSPSTTTREMVIFTNSDWLISPTKDCPRSARALLRMKSRLPAASEEYAYQQGRVNAEMLRRRPEGSRTYYKGKDIQTNPTIFLGTIISNYHKAGKDKKPTHAAARNIDYVVECSKELQRTLARRPHLTEEQPEWLQRYNRAMNESDGRVRNFSTLTQVEDMLSFGDVARYFGEIPIAVTLGDVRNYKDRTVHGEQATGTGVSTLRKARENVRRKYVEAAKRINKFVTVFRENRVIEGPSEAAGPSSAGPSS